MLPTEGTIAANQDGSSWLESLLTGAVNAYTAVSQQEVEKLQARATANKTLGSVPSAAQPAPASIIPGISNTVLIVGSIASLIGLVLIMRK